MILGEDIAEMVTNEFLGFDIHSSANLHAQLGHFDL